MKTTLESVTRYALGQGWEPVQIDGIPEGFSYKKPDLGVGGILHKGGYVVFVPLQRFTEQHMGFYIADTEEELLKWYNKQIKDGKQEHSQRTRSKTEV